MTLKSYLFNVAVALDQLCNTLCAGHPDETISSRCYRNSGKYWYAKAGMRILDVLFRPWGEEHCKAAYENELKRAQLFEGAGIAKF